MNILNINLFKKYDLMQYNPKESKIVESMLMKQISFKNYQLKKKGAAQDVTGNHFTSSLSCGCSA